MANTIIIRKAFSSRDDAEGARDRLHYGGFPREDIAIVGAGQHFELAIHTRPEHAQQVQDCINSSSLTLQAARYGRLLREHAPSAGQSLLLLGSIAATAVAVVFAFSRNRQRWLEDSGNIDRRWDRADRLVDTRDEDRRSESDQRFGPRQSYGSPGLSPHGGAYGA
jgi:hypothetical protein